MKCNKIEVIDSVFTDSTSLFGGIMEILYSNSLDFQNSTFQNSISSNDGGALYLSYIKDDITINKCNFYKNNGLNGGAVFLSNERPNITVKIADNIVSGNTAK